jgi:hypothetical protein
LSNNLVTIPISDIEISGRYRKDFGDISGLADDINKIDLIVPITVTYNPTTKKYTLVDGQRRILSYQILERTEIPCYVINLEKIILGEFSANTYRKDWTDSELYTITEALKPIFTEEAKKRQSEAGKLFGRGKKNLNVDSKSIAMGKFPQANTKGRALDNLSNAFGIDRKTLDKIQKIGDAVKENPEKYKPLLEKVDSKKISREEAIKIIKKDQYKQELRESNQGKELSPEDERNLYNEDFNNFIEPTDDRIKKGFVKLIFTDIEYKKESVIRLCPGLFYLAIKTLPKRGSLMTYAGQYSIPYIVRILDEVNSKIEDPEEKLSWFWMGCVKHTGKTAKMHCQKLKIKWKPLLWFVKGSTPRRLNEDEYIDDFLESEIDDYVESEPPEKELHEWAQSRVEAEYYIKHLTNEGDIVLDPMMGSEATGVAALNMNRRFIGIEIDTNRFNTGKDRIIRDTNNNSKCDKNEY